MYGGGVTPLSAAKYTRPEKTYTDNLTKEQKLEKLEGYKQEDIENITTGTHVRYITKDGKEKKFRMGGFLFKNSGLPDYVILRNNSKSWSVQTKNTIFFRKLSLKEITKDHKDKVNALKKKISTCELKIEEVQEENIALKKELKKHKSH